MQIHEWKIKSIYYYQANQDSFANLQLQIAEKYQQAGQLGNWLNCYDTIIRSYRKHDQSEKSVKYFEELYKNIWSEPTDSFALVTLGESNRQIGFIYYREKDDYSKALPFYDEGIRLVTKANGWNPEMARLFYKAAGNCASRMDDYEKSMVYNELNVKVCREFKDTINLWQGLNDLSYAYMGVGKLDKAEEVLKEDYALVVRGDSTEQKIDACSSLADLYMKKNELDSATKYMNLCFGYLSLWKNKEADSEADLNRQQGLLFSMEKKFGPSEKSYARAVELMETSEEGRRRECGKVYVEFGKMFLAQNKEQQALQKFQRALSCFIPEFKTEDLTVTPDSSMLYDENGLFEVCEGKGDANMSLFYKTKDKQYLQAAADNYRAAKVVLDKRDRGMSNESSRIVFNESVTNIIHKSNVADSLLRIYIP